MSFNRLLERTLDLFRRQSDRPSKQDIASLQSDVASLKDTLDLVLQSLSNQNAAARENRRLISAVEERSEFIRNEVMAELASRSGGVPNSVKVAQPARKMD